MNRRTESLISALKGRAEVNKLTGEFEKSLADHKRILSLCEEDQTSESKTHTQHTLISIAILLAQSKNEHRKARSMVQKALREAKKHKAQRIIARAYNVLGMISWYQGKFNLALEQYRETISRYKKLKEAKRTGKVYGAMGVIYQEKGELDKALEYHKKDHAISRKIADRFGIAVASNNIGLVYHLKGDSKTALQYLTTYYTISEEMGYKRGIALAGINIGSMHRSMGNHVTALQYLENALTAAEELDLKKGIASASASLGLTYLELEQYGKATKHLKMSHTISETICYKMGISIVCGNLGILYRETGELDTAQKYYQRALTAANEIGDKLGIGFAELGIGAIHLEKGRIKEADSCLTTAEKMFLHYGYDKELSETYSLLSQLHTKKGTYKKGFGLAQKAFALAGDAGEIKEKVLALRAMAQANPDRALFYLKKAISLGRKGKGKRELGKSLLLLSRKLEERGERTTAHKHLSEARKIFKELGIKCSS